MDTKNWKGKISNPAQLGGIETAVADNGTARGTRIAWINTGSGLRYKVVLDRGMDIADAFFNQHSLSWISHLGIRPAEPFSNTGAGWLKTFAGGLLVTCGLSHIGGGENDEFGSRGLHGDISNQPAEIESIVQPDPFTSKMEMTLSGSIKETKVFGPSLELKRTISGTLGKAEILIHDEVINRGNTRVPHMLLYHCNFGWPLVDEGTSILWSGTRKSLDGDTQNTKIKKGRIFRACPPPLKEHSGGGEAVAFIDVKPEEDGTCRCGLHNSGLGMAVVLSFKKNQLPWLTNWQHWGSGEYVTGLEPGTNPPVGQAKARKDNTLLFLEPGEVKCYDLKIEVLNTGPEIQHFLTTTKNQP